MRILSEGSLPDSPLSNRCHSKRTDPSCEGLSSAADALLAATATIALLHETAAHAHLGLWLSARLLGDNAVQGHGLHGLLLLGGIDGRHLDRFCGMKR